MSECLETNITKANGITIAKQFDTSKFLYNGIEVLPYKITKRTNNAAGTGNIINYLSYSNSGKIVKDSVISLFHDSSGNYSSSTSISTYTYVSNQIFIYSTVTSSRSESNYTKIDTITLDANTNISTKHTYLIYETQPQETNFYISTYTYGSNPSPLVNLNICNKLGISEPNYYFSYQQGSRNNLTSLMTEVYNNGVYSGTVVVVDNLSTYTFKANGYPDTLYLKYEGSNEIKRLIYQYKSL